MGDIIGLGKQQFGKQYESTAKEELGVATTPAFLSVEYTNLIL